MQYLKDSKMCVQITTILSFIMAKITNRTPLKTFNLDPQIISICPFHDFILLFFKSLIILRQYHLIYLLKYCKKYNVRLPQQDSLYRFLQNTGFLVDETNNTSKNTYRLVSYLSLKAAYTHGNYNNYIE